MVQGQIIKALSGFYYVDDGSGRIYSCRARGKFRHQGRSPLVGDRVLFTPLGERDGSLDEVLARKNAFRRPAVANIDQLVLIVSAAIPKSDPFLIDRILSTLAGKDCEGVICINKCDLDPGEELSQIYRAAGFPVFQVSAATGEGMDVFSDAIAGKVVAFTGNSGVGKSSILNMLAPEMGLKVGEVSQKLGRGRHTTRHVEFFRLSNGAVVADTPGFSSFDEEEDVVERKEQLAETFPEFIEHIKGCYFTGCTHRKEKGCTLLSALREGKISPSRHESYVRLYEQAEKRMTWERK